MNRWRRMRAFFARRQALLDALEEAYTDATRYRRERDALADQLYIARLTSAPRSIP